MMSSSENNVLINTDLDCLVTSESDLNLTSGERKVLCVLVEIKPSKDLYMQLTDENDPLLLISSRLTENDFINLRSSLGILVDFNAFPFHFVDLIKKCTNRDVNGGPSYLAVLRLNDSRSVSSMRESEFSSAAFQIVERNVFRNLCHFNFQLSCVSGREKFEYLAQCIDKLKISLSKEKKSSSCVNQDLSGEVERLNEVLREKDMEIRELGKKLMDEKLESSKKKVIGMQKEKEKMLKLQSDLDRHAAREKKKIMDEYSKTLDDTRKKLDETKNRNDKLKDERNKVSNHNRELQNRLLNRESNLKELSEEMKQLQSDCAAKDKYISSADRKEDDFRTARHELKSAKTMLSEMEKEILYLKQLNANLKVDLHQSSEKIRKREESAAKLFVDFQKSLEIIKDFQEKYRNEKAKVLPLKKLIDELSRDKEHQSDMANKILSLETMLEQKQTLISDLENKLDTVEAKVGDFELEMKSKEEEIVWLNRQLNKMGESERILRDVPLAAAYMSVSKNVDSKEKEPDEIESKGPITSSTPLANFNYGAYKLASKGLLRESAIKPVAGIKDHLESRGKKAT